MTLKEAYKQLRKEIPGAEYISIGVDVDWSPRFGGTLEISYTVAVTVNDERHQQSCVPDLEGGVRTVIGEINGSPKDLATLSREVAAMQDIHGADELAELSSDQG